MQSVPLAAKLKRRAHRDTAFAQDVLVSEAYDAFPSAVLHGGTAIWRCYGGSRFSEDVDAYLPGYTKAQSERFRDGLAAKGVKEVKFKSTANTVFGKFELGGAPVSFEGVLRGAPARVPREYETLGGRVMLVSVLPPDWLLAEKAEAYLDRRKVRDLYDVFFLLNRAGTRVSARALRSLSDGYRPPTDESQLRALVLAGAVPTSGEMIEEIRRWGRRST